MAYFSPLGAIQNSQTFANIIIVDTDSGGGELSPLPAYFSNIGTRTIAYTIQEAGTYYVSCTANVSVLSPPITGEAWSQLQLTLQWSGASTPDQQLYALSDLNNYWVDNSADVPSQPVIQLTVAGLYNCAEGDIFFPCVSDVLGTGENYNVEGYPSSQFTVFRVAGSSPPQPPPTPPAYSEITAWTFVLDGHRFYVLSLGEQGDWAYDFTTQEWCQLQTQMFEGINLTHGAMWGIRIVGGDLLYPTLYELDPNQPLDMGTTEVQHMVTGGIPSRTRSVIGVANFTLTASVGDDSEDDMAISLAFSDDNGVTWSPEFDMPLTDMSTQSLIWNALGSFAAPGRVFRVTDYSGPIRLDGADVVLTIGSGADSGQQSDGQRAQ